MASAISQDDTYDETSSQSRTDLDSHANMAVLGKNSFIIATGRTADVKPFSPDYDAMPDVPIVDGVIFYHCTITQATHTLVLRNALSVPTMDHNLIPPFLMREAGLVVNDTAKIHIHDPDVSDHSIFFPNVSLRIPLSLWGTFSFFPTYKPTLSELQDNDENVLLITPDGPWNPHSDTFARNEENLTDWEGNIVPKSQRQRILIDDLDDDPEMTESMMISSVETRESDMIDENALTLTHTKTTSLESKLTDRAHLGNYMMSIGATSAWHEDFLFDDSQVTEEATDSLKDMNFDSFMAGSTTASSSRGVSAEHLSKIWRIDLETARKTIDVTTQRCKRSETSSLSRNYSTGDRMLRYRRISEFFFMDTFFATKTAKKSSRGYMCMQLFVTDKGFVYVIPMKSKVEVPQAVKAFAKEIGAPDAIICDGAGEQTSHALKAVLSTIDTSLRVLERGTPWSNRAELYIGIMKESVRQDLKASDCPVAFWDY